MRFTTVITIPLLLVGASVAFPRLDVNSIARVEQNIRCNDQQQSRLFKVPPKPKDTHAAPRPDKQHPYIAPGPHDQRGPCPALNTLANHGYIPRNGVATTEQIIMGVEEGFNMEHDFASFSASFATLARGNANTAMLSIGFNDSRVPPLPGCIDGPVAGGLAKHGRFEGDVSNTRRDAHAGDSVHFQLDLFEEFVNNYVSKYGGDSADGPNTLINIKAFQEFKYDRFNEDQKEDKRLEFHLDRQLTAYAEVAFILELLAGENNNTHTLTVNRMRTIFQNQTFPKGFIRREGGADLAILSATAGAVRSAHPISPGANDVNGNYVADSLDSSDFLCAGYIVLLETQVAEVLDHQKGIFKQNVDTMLAAVFKPFHDFANCTTMARPKGKASM